MLCYILVLLLVPLWRREERTHPRRPGGRHWLRAAWGLAGLLGLILAFAWLVVQRPLSYLEAFAALLVGYRLLDWGLEERYWSVILLPGIAALVYLSHVTAAWQTYVLMLGLVWLFELGYLQVRFQYRRAKTERLPLSEVRTGDVPRTGVKAADGEVLCEGGRPLTKAQTRRLRELGREGGLANGNSIEMEQAFPFVPFITAGALLTAVFAGNLTPLVALAVWLQGGGGRASHEPRRLHRRVHHLRKRARPPEAGASRSLDRGLADRHDGHSGHAAKGGCTLPSLWV